MMEDQLLDELYALVSQYLDERLAWEIVYDAASTKLEEYHDLDEEAVNNNVQTKARILEA